MKFHSCSTTNLQVIVIIAVVFMLQNSLCSATERLMSAISRHIRPPHKDRNYPKCTSHHCSDSSDRDRGRYPEDKYVDEGYKAGSDDYKPKEDRYDGDDYKPKEDRYDGGDYKPKEDRYDGGDYKPKEDRYDGDDYKPKEDQYDGDDYKPKPKDDYDPNPGADDYDRDHKPVIRDEYKPKPPVRIGYNSKPIIRDEYDEKPIDEYKPQPPVRVDYNSKPVDRDEYDEKPKPPVRVDYNSKPVDRDEYDERPKPPIRVDYNSKPIDRDDYDTKATVDDYKPDYKPDFPIRVDYNSKPLGDRDEYEKPKTLVIRLDYNIKPAHREEYDEKPKHPVRVDYNSKPDSRDDYAPKPPVVRDEYDHNKPSVADEYKPQPPIRIGYNTRPVSRDDYDTKPVINDGYKPDHSVREDYKPVEVYPAKPPTGGVSNKPHSTGGGGGYYGGYTAKPEEDYKISAGDGDDTKYDEDYNEENKQGDDKGDGRPSQISGDCICVPYYQCTEGHIVTDGAGIIDARKRPQADEELPLDGKFKPPSCGPFHVCCNTPETSTVKPYEHRCGVRNPSGINSRILSPSNKGEADFGEWPWQAAVLKSEGTVNIFQCGGVLIDKYHVLTVAHCVFHLHKYTDYPLKVRLGEWDTQTTSEFLAHEDYKVSKIAIHPEYRNTSLWNDVAILRLEDPVLFAPHIDTVCLPKYDENFAGQNCVVTGWGKDSYKGGTFSNVMKEVALQVIDNYGCEEMLRKTRLGRFFQLHEGFVCAGGEHGLDSCKGDGGGPLVCYRKDRSYALAGLVSWGIDCGQPGVPGVYVKMQKYLDWISKTTGVDVQDYWPKH